MSNSSSSLDTGLLEASIARAYDGKRRWPHRNIPAGLIVIAVTAVRGTLWMVVDAYVLKLHDGFGTNTNVGIMEGLSGIANIAAVLLSGMALEGSLGTVGVLRCVALAAVLVSILTCVAVLYLPSHASTRSVYLMLCAASTLSGLASGLFLVAFEALFGDSMPSGPARTQFLAYKQVAATLGLCTGPLIAMLCFALAGNTWTRPELTAVVTVCAAVGLVHGALCLCFREARPSVGASEGAGMLQPRASASAGAGMVAHAAASTGAGMLAHASVTSRDNDTSLHADPAHSMHTHQHASTTQALGGSTAIESTRESSDGETPMVINGELPTYNATDACCAPDGVVKPLWYVPHLISLSSIFIGLGSSFAYYYIPLFCLSHPSEGGLALSPVAVFAIVLSIQLLAPLLGMGARTLSEAVGPVGTTVCYMGVANVALLFVALSGDDVLRLPTAAVVSAILVRGASMNACGGMTGAVFNEQVSSSNRAKWAMIAQLSRCTWPASAFVSGVLIDNIGYRSTMVVPLVCHVLATLLLLPLSRKETQLKVSHS